MGIWQKPEGLFKLIGGICIDRFDETERLKLQKISIIEAQENSSKADKINDKLSFFVKQYLNLILTKGFCVKLHFQIFSSSKTTDQTVLSAKVLVS